MNLPHALMTPEKAEEVVETLNNADDDWTYKAKHDPTGKGLSYIETYDEEGNLVDGM